MAKLKVLLAYPAFESYFRQHFPEMELATNIKQIAEANLIIFSGGEDINPEIYNESNTDSGINIKRDSYELLVLKLAEESNAMFLGVCRGHQLLNAYYGGKLVQHIEPEHSSFHNVKIISKHSFESELFPEGVCSLHHQGVIKPGKGLFPLTKVGNVFESSISEKILSVQYHPEFMPSRAEKFFDMIKNKVRSGGFI